MPEVFMDKNKTKRRLFGILLPKYLKEIEVLINRGYKCVKVEEIHDINLDLNWRREGTLWIFQ